MSDYLKFWGAHQPVFTSNTDKFIQLEFQQKTKKKIEAYLEIGKNSLFLLEYKSIGKTTLLSDLYCSLDLKAYSCLYYSVKSHKKGSTPALLPTILNFLNTNKIVSKDRLEEKKRLPIVEEAIEHELYKNEKIGRKIAIIIDIQNEAALDETTQTELQLLLEFCQSYSDLLHIVISSNSSSVQKKIVSDRYSETIEMFQPSLSEIQTYLKLKSQKSSKKQLDFSAELIESSWKVAQHDLKKLNNLWEEILIELYINEKNTLETAFVNNLLNTKSPTLRGQSSSNAQNQLKAQSPQEAKQFTESILSSAADIEPFELDAPKTPSLEIQTLNEKIEHESPKAIIPLSFLKGKNYNPDIIHEDEHSTKIEKLKTQEKNSSNFANNDMKAHTQISESSYKNEAADKKPCYNLIYSSIFIIKSGMYRKIPKIKSIAVQKPINKDTQRSEKTQPKDSSTGNSHTERSRNSLEKNLNKKRIGSFEELLKKA